MVNLVYNLFSWKDCILFLSLLFNLGIVLNYFNRKYKEKEARKRAEIMKERQRRIERIRKIKMNSRIRDWKIWRKTKNEI